MEPHDPHRPGPKITVVLNGEVVNEIDLTRWNDGTLNPRRL